MFVSHKPVTTFVNSMFHVKSEQNKRYMQAFWMRCKLSHVYFSVTGLNVPIYSIVYQSLCSEMTINNAEGRGTVYPLPGGWLLIHIVTHHLRGLISTVPNIHLFCILYRYIGESPLCSQIKPEKTSTSDQWTKTHPNTSILSLPPVVFSN